LAMAVGAATARTSGAETSPWDDESFTLDVL